MEYKEKLISIIIPVYNVAKYLPDCLLSLDRQDFADDVEVLLVDDGSTDDSLEICEEKARRDNHYRVFHHDNHGVAYTRNRGLQLANGKYIAWIDPDDYITNDWYSSIRELLKNGLDLLYFDYYILLANKSRPMFYDDSSRMISREELFYELSIGDKIQSHLVTKIMPKVYYFGDKTFNNEFSFCEDYEALARILEKVENIFYLHKPLYIYRQRTGSIVNVDGEKRLQNSWLSITLIKDRYDYINSMGFEASGLGYMMAYYKFCYRYQIFDNKNDLWDLRYQSVIKELKKCFFTLLKTPRMSYRNKLRLILVIFGACGKVHFLKRKLKNILLRESR